MLSAPAGTVIISRLITEAAEKGGGGGGGGGYYPMQTTALIYLRNVNVFCFCMSNALNAVMEKEKTKNAHSLMQSDCCLTTCLV